MSKRPSGKFLSRIWHDYIRHHWLKLIVAVFFMLLEAGAMVIFVKQLQPMIDEVFQGKSADKIGPITLMICGVFIVRGFGSFIHRTLTVKTGLHVVADIQRDLASHLLRLEISFFNKHSPGELIDRVRGDTLALQSLASGTLLTVGRDAAMLIGMLVAAIQIDPIWTIMIFVGAPLLALPINLLQKRIRRQSVKARETSALLSTRLDEIFHGIRAIKLNNLAAHENKRFTETLSLFVKKTMTSEISRAAMPSMIDIIAGMGFVAVILYGGMEIINGEKTTGAFMTFFAAISLMFDPIRRLTNISGSIQAALANLERIYFLFDQKPRHRPNAVQSLNNPKGDIVFKQVHFAYDDTPVLNNLSFIAPGGKTTAFVGPSGAGKSTLFSVLTQLESPQSGVITIGGDNVTNIDLMKLRTDIAVVSQESALFDESIRNNIWLGDTNRTDAEIEQVAETALVNDFVKEMPNGLNSLAGPRGTNLSGGQRQRVIIARAVLSNAPILLLDEATSALDNQTERKIQALLDNFAKDKTTLVIAHRLTTVMNADLIHVMKDGQIVESGTHKELLALNGHYAELHQTLEA
ncbi:MAG: ABC transporter ATP-binding protein [Reinekea sp.]